MLSGANPSDPASVKALLNQRNAQARSLRQQADKYDLDYDPEEFKPLTIKQLPGWFDTHLGGILGGGGKATLAEDTNAGTPASGATAPAGPAGAGKPPGQPLVDANGKIVGYTTDGKTIASIP